MDKAIYSKVNKYIIKAVCKSPMHIGSAQGEKEEVLIDINTGMPFIQATSIAGSFSDFYKNKVGKNNWFGGNGENGIDARSKIVFSDAVFDPKKTKLELRTRVNIDDKTGTGGSSELKGSGVKSGHVLNTEYISCGSEFEFLIYQFLKKDEDDKKVVEDCLKALNSGNVLLGGQLSNGCGCVSLYKVDFFSFDLEKNEHRKLWSNEENDKNIKYTDILEEINKIEMDNSGYNIEFVGEIEKLIVKANFLDADLLEKTLGREIKSKLPDTMSISNANKDFIIPGSSLKGAFKSRINSILNYMDIKKLSENAFEDRSKIFFYDSIIDKPKINLVTRTAINKFTGGVKDKALFSEAEISGETVFNIFIDTKVKKENLSKEDKKERKAKEVWNEEEARKFIVLLLFAVRDFSKGIFTLGSGYSVGRGFSNIKKVRVFKDKENLITIDEKGNMKDEKGFFKECLNEIKKECNR